MVAAQTALNTGSQQALLCNAIYGMPADIGSFWQNVSLYSVDFHSCCCRSVGQLPSCNPLDWRRQDGGGKMEEARVFLLLLEIQMRPSASVHEQRSS